MHYTAIIKDGGLFIPNVFSDLNDGGSHIVQVEVDIEDVREQLNASEASTQDAPKKSTSKAAPKKAAKRPTKQALKKATAQSHSSSNALDELEGLDDSELSEIFKAYVNDGQISLENL